MTPLIREELPADFQSVELLIREAFAHMPESNQEEHHLVKRLRSSKSFIPELSLVAIIQDHLVGHILLTRAIIENDTSRQEVLALAPVSVLPEFQAKGIGTSLIQNAHEIATGFGFSAIVLIGHADYYPRFGYMRASEYGISFPFDIPDENGMICFLDDGFKETLRGTISYDPAFFE